ncbi:MAG: phosphate ABC transporter permease PstA [Verrucomicrobiota bacterium]|nr:phosphate ABC transporter permease PstA [Verrucomicrobiota bacterium]
MLLETRKLLDKSFTAVGIGAILLMIFALAGILLPIIWKGSGAFIFKGTVEHRKIMFDLWNRGDQADLQKELKLVEKIRAPLFAKIKTFKTELKKMPRTKRREFKNELKNLKKTLEELIGPFPGERQPVLLRQRYGCPRWDRTLIKLKEVLYITEWDYSNPEKGGIKKLIPRRKYFKNTSMESFFPYLKENIENIMQPHLTFYPQFLTDSAKDSHIFGGIWPELLGTIYLTLGAMLFAVPMGVIAAIYFCEFASNGPVISFLRISISTLAGVPSIVFGLFGLAFFMNTIHLPKSVLTGSLTLALLILPTIIRASEEAILAVPRTYKEAALALGGEKIYTTLTVTLPVALPGILTGIILSMGRAAGETAPIIFTAAVSVGSVLKIDQLLTNPTPSLSWNIYNLCTEHEAVDEIRHVQYGMVLALIAVVVLLNLVAIFVRARVSSKLQN